MPRIRNRLPETIYPRVINAFAQNQPNIPNLMQFITSNNESCVNLHVIQHCLGNNYFFNAKPLRLYVEKMICFRYLVDLHSRGENNIPGFTLQWLQNSFEQLSKEYEMLHKKYLEQPNEAKSKYALLDDTEYMTQVISKLLLFACFSVLFVSLSQRDIMGFIPLLLFTFLGSAAFNIMHRYCPPSAENLLLEYSALFKSPYEILNKSQLAHIHYQVDKIIQVAPAA